MKWKKLKQIFCPDNNYDWMVSHAANPVAEHIGGDIYRVYFSCRDAQNHSHIGYLDMDMADNCNVVAISSKPVLSPGQPGLFDDSGVSMGCLLHIDGQKYLYYMGWNLKVTVPWLNTIGLARWNEQSNSFEKHSRAPVMDRSDEDPFTLSYPFILPENGVFKMWYGSNLNWKSTEDMEHIIKYAESNDGITWRRNNDIVINLAHPNEHAIARPVVMKTEGAYQMWYSFKGTGDIRSYRIGYAASTDGNSWKRKDNDAGIDVSPAGWDSEMICYPHIFEHNGNLYMLYNGNGHGKSGFGIAQLIMDK